MGFRTGVSPLLTELRNKWYPNGRKTVPEKELEKLDSLGLAIWYLDDGTYSYGRNFCSLSIGDFKNQKPLLRRLFKERWGLNSSLMKSGTKSCSLYFPVEDSDKFLHLIAEHVHPSMVYKLGHIHPANNSKLKEAIQKRRERDNRLAKEYYKKNRDKILLYQRKYRRKNKEKISASFREYRSKNKSKLSERKHEYYLKNREKVLKHSREYWHRRGKFLRAERMKKVA